MLFSIVVPTFNRPDELTELLESLTKQALNDFDVIIVDGSPTEILHPVINKYSQQLNILYFHKKGLKASPSRNYGVEQSKARYILFVDSDCILPESYIEIQASFLKENPNVDAFGGPDQAHSSFTVLQKAINYAMTSKLTTGGIRGKKKHVGKFQLRGFNMGMKRDIFNKANGFSQIEVGEDIDLSMRLHKMGAKLKLNPDAFVYHKRRTSLSKFYRQLFMHGKGRIDLYKRHDDALKFVHFLPSVFTLGLFLGLVLSIIIPNFFYVYLGGIALYSVLIFIDSLIENKNTLVALRSILTSYIMLIAYGLGLTYNYVKRIVFKIDKDSEKSIILKN